MVVLMVGLAHVVVVGSVGVSVIGRVEPVSEVVKMLRVRVHQTLQRPRVDRCHHLKMFSDCRLIRLKTESYLVLYSVSGLYVFLEVTVVIESHPTLVTHYVLGLEMNFVDVLT